MKISDLVNKSEPFTFEFDGEKIEGRYYKYKTTTPAYAKSVTADLPEVLTVGTEEEIAKSKEARDEAASRIGFQAIADTIIEWDCVDDEGAQVAPTRELFEKLPRPFTEKFIEFFNSLRDGNPTNGNGLPTG